MGRRGRTGGRTRGARRAGPMACVAGLLLAGVAGAAGADECHEAGRRVSFRVEASREVTNDRVRAVVAVVAEGADAADLADEVNRTMAWALDRARSAEAVEARSGAYHTSPVYEDGRLRRWRASQELILESADAEAVTALVGTLQSRLPLRSFEFSVSHARRAEVEEALVAEVLAAFRARAERVREHLGAGGHAIDQLSIETGAQGPPVMRAMEMRAASAPAPPAVEGGSSRIVVTAHGTIVLE